MSDLGLVVPGGLQVPTHVVEERARDRQRQTRELVDWLWPISSCMVHMPNVTREQNRNAAAFAFYGEDRRKERGERLWAEMLERVR